MHNNQQECKKLRVSMQTSLVERTLFQQLGFAGLQVKIILVGFTFQAGPRG